MLRWHAHQRVGFSLQPVSCGKPALAGIPYNPRDAVCLRPPHRSMEKPVWDGLDVFR